MVNLFRIIGYCVIFLLDVLLYYFLHSHFTFIVMILMLVAPVISIVSVFVLRKFITAKVVNLNTGAQYGKQDEEAYFQIRIKNPTPFVCLNLKLKLSISNTFFKTTGERVLEVPLYAFKGYTLDFPVIAKLPGIVSVTVDTVKVSDIMGFFVLVFPLIVTS